MYIMNESEGDIIFVMTLHLNFMTRLQFADGLTAIKPQTNDDELC